MTKILTKKTIIVVIKVKSFNNNRKKVYYNIMIILLAYLLVRGHLFWPEAKPKVNTATQGLHTCMNQNTTMLQLDLYIGVYKSVENSLFDISHIHVNSIFIKCPQ
jgi:hypothetical protein